MAKSLQITLPDAVVDALTGLGARLELTAAEYLKQYVLASSVGDVGALKLRPLIEGRAGEVSPVLETAELFEESGSG